MTWPSRMPATLSTLRRVEPGCTSLMRAFRSTRWSCTDTSTTRSPFSCGNSVSRSRVLETARLLTPWSYADSSVVKDTLFNLLSGVRWFDDAVAYITRSVRCWTGSGQAMSTMRSSWRLPHDIREQLRCSGELPTSYSHNGVAVAATIPCWRGRDMNALKAAQALH